MEGTVGEIRIFAGMFAPDNWSFCDGSPLKIEQYPELYSVIGLTYGGNGSTTFLLPDLTSPAESGSHGRYIICRQGLYPRRDD